jgi:hypothetical protein
MLLGKLIAASDEAAKEAAEINAKASPCTDTADQEEKLYQERKNEQITAMIESNFEQLGIDKDDPERNEMYNELYNNNQRIWERAKTRPQQSSSSKGENTAHTAEKEPKRLKTEDSKEPFMFDMASPAWEPNVAVAALDAAKAEHDRLEQAEAESRQLSKSQSQASITSADAKEVATGQLTETRAEGQEHWSPEQWAASNKYWHTDEQKYQPALARFYKNDPVRMLYTENEVMRTSKVDSSISVPRTQHELQRRVFSRREQKAHH